MSHRGGGEKSENVVEFANSTQDGGGLIHHSHMTENISSNLEVLLHPLVVINVSDHHTRTRAKAKSGSPTPRVFGVLMGVQTGRRIEIFTSFAIPVTVVDDNTVFDITFVDQRKSNSKPHSPIITHTQCSKFSQPTKSWAGIPLVKPWKIAISSCRNRYRPYTILLCSSLAREI